MARTRPDGIHEATGHGGAPEGTPHEPVWGEWQHEWANLEMRQCRHPDCDVDDYRNIKP